MILLNPRIIEYDVAPLTLPLALIGWRALRAIRLPFQAAFGVMGLAAINAFALFNWKNWKLAEGIVLILFFCAGSATLLWSEADEPTTADTDLDIHVLVVPGS